MSSPTKETQASVQSVEPEDPRSDAQSAQRLALDKKQKGKQAERHPAEVSGQHATGSFTDRK